MKQYLIIFLLLCSVASFGQIRRIQWASSLGYQYNQYKEGAYDGHEVLGAPNAFPPGHLHPNAFRLVSQSAFGTLKVGFAHPQPAQQIIIVENNDPGRIIQVKLIDEFGFNYIIYQQDPQKVHDNFRTMVLSIPHTDYNIQSIEINVNSIPKPGYPQIDAVGIVDGANLEDIRNIMAGANFNVQQVMTFTAKKEKLKNGINSRFAEAKPIVSHDGNTLYFSRLFYPLNTGGKTDPQDIYMSKYLDGQWTNAENVGSPLNDIYTNGVCSISPDGNKLLLINGYQPDGSITPGVSISHHTAIGWGSPMGLDIKDYKNSSQFQDFFLSADERVIIMAVQRPEGYGDQDLYVSLKIGPKSYSRPRSLGMSINTSKADFAPFLSPDNTTLYFASEGHGGYGQSDIFRTKRLDGSWRNWSEPQNLGPSINTSSWEAYFSITAAGDYAYFVSSEGARHGEENIYRIPLLQDVVPEIPKPLIAFQGRTFDAITNEPVQANVILENQQKHRPYRASSDHLTGNFLFYIPKEDVYEFSVKAPGYVAFFEKISMKPYATNEKIYRNIYLTPIQKDQIFTLNNLMFERSKPNLLDKSYPALEKLVSILMENPAMRIELAGHTDGLGSQKAKKELSFERVEKIKKFLVEFGIDKRRIATVGYGGAHPVAPNDTEENRAKNRRVEVKVLDIGS